MKNFVADQAGQLAIFLVLLTDMIVGFVCISDGQMKYWLFICILLNLLFLCVNCKWILLLPLDLWLGEKAEVVHFSCVTGGVRLRLRPAFYCAQWRFYCGMSQTYHLLIPIPTENVQVSAVTIPQKDQKVRIFYYPLSGILCGWEEVQEEKVSG